MFLTRTLKRTLMLRGPLPEACIAYLRADPRLPAPTERTDLIEIEPRDDGLLAMHSSWGRHMVGSPCAIERAVENAVFGFAVADEAPAPSLNASVLRLDGTRFLLVADVGIELGELTVALIGKGAALEGIGHVFVRAGGVVAHPARPQLRSHRLSASGLSTSLCASPLLHVSQNGLICTVDPRIAGIEWSVVEGPVAIVLFVEWNSGGSSAITRLRAESALTLLMRSLQSVRRPDVRQFVRLRALIDETSVFRLTMGSPVAAAAVILASLPHMSIDEPQHLRQVESANTGDDACGPM